MGYSNACKEAKMVFEFSPYVFWPSDLVEVWAKLRSLGLTNVSSLTIRETDGGLVRIEVDIEGDRRDLIEEMKSLLIRMGGQLVEEQKVVLSLFLPGTFDPSEVLVRIDDFVTVSKRISKTSEPVVEMKWMQDGSLKMKVMMQVGVHENVFLKYGYDKILKDLNAVVE